MKATRQGDIEPLCLACKVERYSTTIQGPKATALTREFEFQLGWIVCQCVFPHSQPLLKSLVWDHWSWMNAVVFFMNDIILLFFYIAFPVEHKKDNNSVSLDRWTFIQEMQTLNVFTKQERAGKIVSIELFILIKFRKSRGISRCQLQPY